MNALEDLSYTELVTLISTLEAAGTLRTNQSNLTVVATFQTVLRAFYL